MALERVYHIPCAACGHTIWQTETMLEQIIHNRLASDVGAPFLVLVCSRCKTGFHYNYEERSVAALLPAPHQTLDRKYPVVFLFRIGCVDSNCESPVQLTVIRDAGTTKDF